MYKDSYKIVTVQFPVEAVNQFYFGVMDKNRPILLQYNSLINWFRLLRSLFHE